MPTATSAVRGTCEGTRASRARRPGPRASLRAGRRHGRARGRRAVGGLRRPGRTLAARPRRPRAARSASRRARPVASGPNAARATSYAAAGTSSATAAANPAASSARMAAAAASARSTRARSTGRAMPAPSSPIRPSSRTSTWPGRASSSASPACAAATCACTSAWAAAVGSAGRAPSASARPSSRSATNTVSLQRSPCTRGTTRAVDAAQRARDAAVRGRLVLEVQLVEQLLAPGAQQRSRVGVRQGGAQRGDERVEQREVVSHRALEPRAPHADRHRLAVDGAAVRLCRGADRERLGIEVVDRLGRKRALDRAGVQRLAGGGACGLELAHDRLADRLRDRQRVDEPCRARQSDPRAGRPPGDRPAGLQQRPQRGRQLSAARR